MLRERPEAEASPSAAVFDSQPVKPAEMGVVETTTWITIHHRKPRCRRSCPDPLRDFFADPWMRWVLSFSFPSRGLSVVSGQILGYAGGKDGSPLGD